MEAAKTPFRMEAPGNRLIEGQPIGRCGGDSYNFLALTGFRGDSMNYETLRVEIADKIAKVTLNRPDKRNAMNPQMHRDMTALLEELRYDDDVVVLVFTGAGPSATGTGAPASEPETFASAAGLALAPAEAGLPGRSACPRSRSGHAPAVRKSASGRKLRRCCWLR